MAVTIILKNNTAQESLMIEDLGIAIKLGVPLTITELFSLAEIDASYSLKTLVNNGSIIVNNGTSDLSIVDGIDLITLETVQPISTIKVLPTLQLRRTTNFTLTTAYSDISFDTKDIETDSTKLQFSPDGIHFVAHEAGYYNINYLSRVQPAATMDTYLRCLLNDSTIINSSISRVYTYTNEIHEITSSFKVYLNVGDSIKLQAYKGSTSNSYLLADTLIAAFKLEGIKGDKGDKGEPGDGSLLVQKDDVTVSAATTINFEGNVVVESEGSGKVTVNIPTVVGFTPKIAQIIDTVGGVNVNVTTPVAIRFNSFLFLDDYYTLSNYRLYFNQPGIYKISYNCSVYATANNRFTLHTYCRLNGTTQIIPSSAYGLSYNTTDRRCTACASFLIEVIAADYLELLAMRDGTSTNATTIANESWLVSEFIRSNS